MKQQVMLTVRGKQHEWCVHCDMSKSQIDDMIADGVDLGVVYNSFPEWVAPAGLARPWCFIEDLFNFRNPFHK